MKTESRDRKQKEAAAAFVVAEECGNVEALCQTFLKWGQVTFSQRGKATTTTKKSAGGGGGTAAPVSLRRSRPSGERGGRARAGGGGPGEGSGRSSLRGWDVRNAAFAAEPLAGLGRGGGDAGGAGCAAGGGSSATCVALGLAQTPVQALGGSLLDCPRSRFHLLRRVLNGVNVRGSVLAAVPLPAHRGGRAICFFNSWQKASGQQLRGR